MPKLVINGRKANVDVRRYASFHGSSIFTTLRSKNKKPLLWPAHWQRLKHHAAYFSYAMPSENDALEQIEQALNECSLDQKIRVILESQDYALSFEPYEAPLSTIYDGVSIRYSKAKLHPELKQFKTGNSWPYQKALAEAKQHAVFESLLCDNKGFVVDGSRTSIMYFDGTTLFSLEGGLAGIMREEALSFAKQCGVLIKRSYLKPHDLLKGQVMIANCLLGVVPVGPILYDIVLKLVKHFRMDG